MEISPVHQLAKVHVAALVACILRVNLLYIGLHNIEKAPKHSYKYKVINTCVVEKYLEKNTTRGRIRALLLSSLF